MCPILVNWRIPNGGGCTGLPRSRRVRRHGSCPWSGDAGAGSLTPWGAVSGLGGPMPHTIALVVWGRCRPSPDAAPLTVGPHTAAPAAWTRSMPPGKDRMGTTG
ncbi:hypothetical protein GCM10022206_45630 [Streptomyces chiangmaiensis]